MTIDVQITEDQVYDALYQAVGDGLRSHSDSLVEAWRLAKAKGLAAATLDWKAFLQAFPNTATDFIPVYEELLDYQLDTTLSLDAQQAELATRYTKIIDATGPNLSDQLSEIDPNFILGEFGMDPLSIADLSVATEGGVRGFEDWHPTSPLTCGPAFDLGRSYTLFPNYATDFILPVKLNKSGAPTVQDQRAMNLAKDQLNDSLPAWVDFRIYMRTGFILDTDLLDVTVFGY